MASGPHTFTTMVVYSPERFQGQQLALVAVRGPPISPSSPTPSSTSTFNSSPLNPNATPTQTQNQMPTLMTAKRKSQIAREFRCETGYLWDAFPTPMVIPVVEGSGDGKEEGKAVWVRRLEVYDRVGREMVLGLGTILGAAHYLFGFIDRASTVYTPTDRDAQRQVATFYSPKSNLTIPVFYNPYRQVAAVSVPLPVLRSFRVHKESVGLDEVLFVQPQLKIAPPEEILRKKMEGKGWPVVTLAKEMTFILVDLTDTPGLLKSLDPTAKTPAVKLDKENGEEDVGCMYFVRKGRSEQSGEPSIQNLQCRVIGRGEEESGSGEACCALACWLAIGDRGEDELVRKTEGVKLEDKDSGETGKKESLDRIVFGIQQGVEMGRLSTIAVEVDVKVSAGGKRSIASVILSGRGMFMLKGELIKT